jgi:ribonuclease P protein component
MRIGIIVPRHGRTAVARNLLKRRLREIARLELLPQQLPLDIVIRTAEPAYELPYARLREQVTALVRRVAGA